MIAAWKKLRFILSVRFDIHITDSLLIAVHAFTRHVLMSVLVDADNIALLANAPAQAKFLLHSLEWATTGIGLHVNAHKTEYMRFNQRHDISTLNGSSLKLVHLPRKQCLINWNNMFILVVNAILFVVGFFYFL